MFKHTYMFKHAIKNVIFPRGKVHPNYLKFIGWNFVSNVIISTESVLSTHSMLSVVSGPQVSNELTMSVNYIGKDIIGQIGGLFILNTISHKADIDNESKHFIYLYTICQQSATFLECATPLLPLYSFIPIAGLANIGKNIGFTGFGSINAKIINKLAQDNNIGEIYIKATSINTFGSTIGMLLGLFIAAKIPDHTARMGIMPILCFLRVYSYNKAVKDLI